MRRVPWVLVLLGFLAPADAVPLSEIDKDFTEAAEPLERATVLVRAADAQAGPGSSGVVMHPEGYVLSDAAATLLKVEAVGGKPRKVYADKAVIRFPDGKLFKATLLRRDDESDSSLLKIDDPGSFKAVRPGSSDELGAGAFVMLCGNAFGTANEGRPAVSLGVVSAADPRDPADGAGRYAQLVTSAAVNPGSNGGPCADAEGRLAGIVSTWGGQRTSAWYGLGIVTPINRIRSRYRDLPCAGKVFPDPKTLPPRAHSAVALEEAFRIVARRASPAIVSLVFKREAGASHREMVNGPDGKPVEIEVYQGPVSGVLYSADGYILTSTYNLWSPEKIQGAEAFLQDGRSFPAKLLGRDQVRGIALLKVEAKDLPFLQPAPPGKLQVGQFVFALGNPRGAAPAGEPFFTFGLLSTQHQLDKNRDALQTDAGMNDANAGGALVNLRGRLIGVNTLVAPARFGRNSGIGFAIPVGKIEEALPGLKQGKNVIPGYLGVVLQQTKDGKVAVAGVQAGGAAQAAGLKGGDLVVLFDGQAVDTVAQLMDLIGALLAGQEVTLKVIRDNGELEFKATLGERPES